LSIHTPVVLVGHSYGGMVISNVANGQANVKALVYVAAFAPRPEKTRATSTASFRAA
jgi:pimeloyl-ACP methyl ester carboxylesterase